MARAVPRGVESKIAAGSDFYESHETMAHPPRTSSSLTESEIWPEFRRQMPICRRWSYLDHAAVAPLSAPAAAAIRGWLDQATDAGDTAWPQWESRLEEIRALVARLINAQPTEITFTPNTTAGINLVAEGLPWLDGDNVVTVANEFPSNLYPWMNLSRQGVETRRVEMPEGVIDINRLLAACDSRTRVVSVSWIGYATGYRIDVAEVCAAVHERGALMFLDAIQGLGVFPLDVVDTQVDFLAADGHKWMLGPEGAGLAFIRHDLLNQLVPRSVGWNSVQGRYSFDEINLDLRNEAARYEGGSQNMVGFHGLGASLELFARSGLTHRHSRLAQRVLEISNLACERIQSAGGTIRFPRKEMHRSGIVTFELPGTDPSQLRTACQKAHIAVSCRGGGVRISPHAYNNEEDIQRLITVLESV